MTSNVTPTTSLDGSKTVLKLQKAYLLPVLVGLVIRLVWIYFNPHLIVWDEVPYHELGVRISQLQSYGTPFWPPGYPLLLGLIYRVFGGSVEVAIGLNLVTSVLTVVLTGLIALEYFGKRVALLSLWVTALMPSYVLPIVLVRYEVVMQFLLALALWLAIKADWTWRRVLALSIITATLTLMRPFWFFLPALLWLCSRAKSSTKPYYSRLVAAHLLTVFLVLPWVVYSSYTAERFVPIAMNGGMNLWIGNNPSATGKYISPPGEYWDPLYEGEARAEAVAYITRHPWRTLGMLPLKVWYSVNQEPWAEWVFGKTNSTLAVT